MAKKRPCAAVLEDGTPCDRNAPGKKLRCDRHRKEYKEAQEAGIEPVFTPHTRKTNKTDEELVQHILANVLHSEHPTLEEPCWMWQRVVDGGGYARMHHHGPKYKVSRLVMRLFKNEEPPEGMEVRHLCGKGRRACVNPAHLRLGTHEENMQDMIADGTSTRGKRNSSTKLTEEQVLEIYTRSWAGEPLVSLGKEFGVHPTTISQIKHGRNWAWLTGHPPPASL